MDILLESIKELSLLDDEDHYDWDDIFSLDESEIDEDAYYLINQPEEICSKFKTEEEAKAAGLKIQDEGVYTFDIDSFGDLFVLPGVGLINYINDAKEESED